MNSCKTIMMCGALVGFLVACDKKADDTAPKDETTSEQPASTEEPEAPAKEEPAKVEQGPITMDTFADRLTDASCTWVSECKNEELVQYLQFGASMMISFGAIGRPDLKAEIEPVVEAFKKVEQEQRIGVTQDECEAIMGLSFKLAHMDAESLKKSVEAGHVVYDASKATACIEGFSRDEKLCTVETKVDTGKQTGFAQMQENEARFKEDLDALTGPCDEVLVGQLEEGAECIESYECKGKAKCKKPDAMGGKRRVDGSQSKKTCTPIEEEGDAPK